MSQIDNTVVDTLCTTVLALTALDGYNHFRMAQET